MKWRFCDADILELTETCMQGLVSSAQMVKFLAINARPTTTRMISRALPQGLSRAFVGR